MRIQYFIENFSKSITLECEGNKTIKLTKNPGYWYVSERWGNQPVCFSCNSFKL